MGTVRLTIYGKNFKLPVHYDEFDDEKDDKDHKKKLEDSLRTFVLSASKEIKRSESAVKDYILSKDADKVGHDKYIGNIHKFIKPKYIYVTIGKVAIMCNYKFDQEHGIAIVFNNGNYSKVGNQDIIL